MKIYLDISKKKGVRYIEDVYSSADIIRMPIDEFITVIKSFGEEIHSCYPAFINHIGRFYRDYGKNWFGDVLEIYANENACGTGKTIQYHFNDKGQIIDWPYGYFS